MGQHLPEDNYPPDSTLDTDAIKSVLASVDSNSCAIAVMPSKKALKQILTTVSTGVSHCDVCILGTESYLSNIIGGQAYIAFATAELDNRDTVSCYQTHNVFSGQHLYSQSEVATLVAPGTTVHITDDAPLTEELITSARAHITDDNVWIPDSPRLGRMKKTCASHLGSKAANELVPLLKRVPVSGAKTDIELLNTMLLLAARHERLFQQVAEWGIEADIAVRSSFTRRRETLVKSGLVQTEKVRVGIKPSQIQLSPQYPLAVDTPLPEYLSTAREMLNTTT